MRAPLLIVGLFLLPGCADDLESTTPATNPNTSSPESLGPELASISDEVGTTINHSAVVPLACIPSRNDPVGVFISVRLTGATIDSDSVSVSLESTDTRLGSHPSGCHDPELALAQSMFLLGPDDNAILAERTTTSGSEVTLHFDVAGRDLDSLAAVLLPTLAYRRGDDSPTTGVYGFVGAWRLA
ncbi:MAG: hypothetical protein ACR2P0_07850 [Acidimicrobiales bacterium]